jgi:phage tail tape-measure protein
MATAGPIKRSETSKEARNEDPISGAPGAHPIGTGVGAALGGAAAGAAAGTVAGPLGTVAGAVIGGVAGGLAGKAVAEQVDPTVEDAYWRETHVSRPYYEQDYTYADYAPAYRTGWEARRQYPDRDWDDVESEVGSSWDKTKGRSRLEWERAKLAARDAWHRVERAIPGDADQDGR